VLSFFLYIVWRFEKKIVFLQPTLGARARTPARVAGEVARVPRQNSEITYINIKKILGARAPSPAIDAGEDARAPRQDSEITA